MSVQRKNPSKEPAAQLVLDDGEQLSPVAGLLEDLTARRPHPSTVWRICVRGTRRAGRLPAVNVLGQWHSTRRHVMAWIERGTAAAINPDSTNIIDDAESADTASN